MLGLLIKKELSEKLVDARFTTTSMLCVVLIPLGMYVSCQDYERRLTDHQHSVQAYRGLFAEEIDPFIEVQGFRPPSGLGVFASGLDAYIPTKVVTSRSGEFRTLNEPVTGSPGSFLFGRTDYLFNITFVVSLAALVFTFNSVSGEREAGTLKLLISHAVPRGHIILSKILGNYISLTLPLLVSLLIALLFMEASPVLSLGSQSRWMPALTIVAVALLYVFVMISLGVWISTQRYYSVNALVIAFFVWTLLALAIPKVSPMLARVVCPIDSPEAISSTKRILREALEDELRQDRERLITRIHDECGTIEEDRLSYPPRTEAGRKARARYGIEVLPLEERFQQRIAEGIQRIDRAYEQDRNRLFNIAISISRISPVSCFVYIVSGIAGTGVTEPASFLHNTQQYQNKVNSAIYEQYKVTTDQRGFDRYSWEFDPKSVTAPQMDYRYPTLSKALVGSWVDLLLLGFAAILSSGAAYRGLYNYDVR